MNNKELLTKVHKRFTLMLEVDQENRRKGLEDMRFAVIPGEQWDENMRQERGNRPCYEFNKIRVTGKRVINDMRANRPSGKVRGVEGDDKATAEIYEGLIRNIWNISDADTVVDYAGEYQVYGGMGAWRVVTEYNSNTAFEQDILIEAIPNPFTLFADPSAKEMLKRDAQDWILTERIPNEEFERRWPKADATEFQSHEFDDEEEWMSDEEKRVAEYWWKEPEEVEIWQLQDGKVIDSTEDEAIAIEAQNPEMIVKRRTVIRDKIRMCICSGDSILEGPTDYAGTIFPFIMVFGEYVLIDGEIFWFGITRPARDAQQAYNVSRTAITETIAQAPQAKWWTTADQSSGHLENWKEAHLKNFPFLLYNPDVKAPGPPTRMGTSDIPIALIQESQIASEEINMVTGIYQSDVGAPNSATSGKQEMVRNQSGQVATFNYKDNMSKGIRLCYDILIDLIPKIYDSERELRILGSDGAESYVKINTFVPDPETGKPIKINDLSVGRYDVTVTTGPSFSTQRQEAAETYQMMLQGNPQIFPFIGDLIFKSMDLPFSEDIAERLKAMLPPEIQQTMNDDTKDVPPEVQQMMQQAQQAMQMVESQMQEVQKAAGEADIAKSEVEKLMAKMDKEKAQFEAKVAQEMAKIAQARAKLTIEAVSGDREAVIQSSREQVAGEAQEFNAAVAGEISRSMQSIHALAAQFNDHAVETMKHIQEEKDNKPKLIRVDAVREKGKLSAVPVYEEESEDDD